ncbi:MAG: PhnD/SsuA/transferrin family substrate-binding protein [Oscillatoria sp. SIO1A7]|nr:PhnD/SsuA/transferrin family substrate-binding protein [Oscillatoria sp. SIO1A7]
MFRRRFLGYFLLFAGGCTAAKNNIDSNNNSLLKEKQKLRLAVSDVQGMADLEQNYGLFRTALEEVLETKIEFFSVDNAVEVAAALQLGLVDIVLIGPSEYVIVTARTNAVPIVALTRHNYFSIIAVRADSDIKSLADLKGKTIELGEIGITGNYIGQMKMLMDAELNPQSDLKIINSIDYKLKALKNGEVDAWGRVVHRYKKALKDEGESEEDYPILARSIDLPNDVFVASSQLESALVVEIRDRMLKNKDKLVQSIVSVPTFSAKFKDSTLAPANDSDYDMIREVYKAME